MNTWISTALARISLMSAPQENIFEPAVEPIPEPIDCDIEPLTEYRGLDEETYRHYGTNIWNGCSIKIPGITDQYGYSLWTAREENCLPEKPATYYTPNEVTSTTPQQVSTDRFKSKQALPHFWFNHYNPKTAALVTRIQKRINKELGIRIVPDGVLGRKTMAAIARFQHKYNQQKNGKLPTDGVPDLGTIAALGIELPQKQIASN